MRRGRIKRRRGYVAAKTHKRVRRARKLRSYPLSRGGIRL